MRGRVEHDQLTGGGGGEGHAERNKIPKPAASRKAWNEWRCSSFVSLFELSLPRELMGNVARGWPPTHVSKCDRILGLYEKWPLPHDARRVRLVLHVDVVKFSWHNSVVALI